MTVIVAFYLFNRCDVRGLGQELRTAMSDG